MNVNCLLRLFSNLFGALISIRAIIPTNNPNIRIELIKIPAQIGAVVNPTQSYASSNRVSGPRKTGCT